MKRFIPVLLIGVALMHPSRSGAHPLSQGEIRVVMDGRTMTLRVSVAVEEIIVQQYLRSRDDDCFVITREACRQHGEYLLKHLILRANNSVAAGAISRSAEPIDAPIHVLDIARTFVSYDITYAFATPPAVWELSETVLNEMEYEPGNRWEIAYITSVLQNGSVVRENMLLNSRTPLKFAITEGATLAPARASATKRQSEAPPFSASETRPVVTKISALIAALVCVLYLFIALMRKKVSSANGAK